MPTEQAAIVEYGASRITVRAAYRRLVELGLVESRQRLGYFARSQSPVVLVPGPGGWEGSAAVSGVVLRAEVRVRVVGGPGDPVPVSVLEGLRLGGGDLVVVRDQVCYAGDRPLMLCLSYFPEVAVRGTVVMRPESAAVPAGILAAAGLEAVAGEGLLCCRMAEEGEAARLEVPTVTPCLEWLQVRAGLDGVPLEVARVLMPGYRVVLTGRLPWAWP